MGKIGSYLRARGIRDGLVRGGRVWTTLGGAAWLVRILSKMATRRPEVVAREVLAPGQSITITSVERTDT